MSGGHDEAAGEGVAAGRGVRVAVVVGNPKARSRTLTVAQTVASMVASELGCDSDESESIDLAGLGPRLFDWSDPQVRAAVDRLATSKVAVVASPTYKGAYTGLLKAFLDWYPTTGLSGVTAVPVMVGGSPRHALAVEVHLRPVLVEIGATVPTRGLYVLESEMDALREVVGAWLVEAAPLLRASTGA